MDIQNIKIISLVFVILLSFNFVYAGVSSPYWKDNPLKMYPGETREDIGFTLVNRPDSEVEQVVVTMENDAGIAQITSGDKYTINPGSLNTKVLLKISVPEGSNVGDAYNIKFSVSSAPKDKGDVQISIRYSVDFPVIIIEKPTTPTLTKETQGLGMAWIFGIGIIIILILIIYLVIKRSK